jgi:hypothetical protein
MGKGFPDSPNRMIRRQHGFPHFIRGHLRDLRLNPFFRFGERRDQTADVADEMRR